MDGNQGAAFIDTNTRYARVCLQYATQCAANDPSFVNALNALPAAVPMVERKRKSATAPSAARPAQANELSSALRAQHQTRAYNEMHELLSHTDSKARIVETLRVNTTLPHWKCNACKAFSLALRDVLRDNPACSTKLASLSTQQLLRATTNAAGPSAVPRLTIDAAALMQMEPAPPPAPPGPTSRRTSPGGPNGRGSCAFRGLRGPCSPSPPARH